MANMDMIFDMHLVTKRKGYFYEKKLNKTPIFKEKKVAKKTHNNYSSTQINSKSVSYLFTIEFFITLYTKCHMN